MDGNNIPISRYHWTVVNLQKVVLQSPSLDFSFYFLGFFRSRFYPKRKLMDGMIDCLAAVILIAWRDFTENSRNLNTMLCEQMETKYLAKFCELGRQDPAAS